VITISFSNKIDKPKLNPAQVLAIGFATIILLGTFILNTPIVSADGKSIGFLNALFTATSSVCITGLVVVNTAAQFNFIGELVILVLIQIGGLGFMTMATIVALFLGKKITLKDRLVMQEELNASSLNGLVRLTKYVILATFILEGIGALLLSTRFIPQYGVLKGIWFSIFHAISAFCNAGFDVIGESMTPFVNDVVVNFTVILLVIIGGLGFTVYIDLSRNKSIRRCSLHTKLVLLITGFLLILGAVFIFLIEYDNPNTLGELSFGGKVLASIFQSTVTRTAGFNSIDMASLTNATSFIFIIFMFIGGSPGSTAGGIKTTTIGVVILAIRAVLKGKDDVEIFKKRIPNELIFRAIAVTGAGLLMIICIIIALTISEKSVDFLDILFETVSAFGTVGLTRNLSSNLTNIGKVIIIITMYVGKVGPLTFVYALAKRKRKNEGKYKFPEEKILIG